MTFSIYDKASNFIKWSRLVIHQRKNWIYIMAYVKENLIFEVSEINE